MHASVQACLPALNEFEPRACLKSFHDRLLSIVFIFFRHIDVLTSLSGWVCHIQDSP